METANHAEMPNGQFRRRAVAVAEMDRAGFDDEALQECVDGEALLLGFRHQECFGFWRNVEAHWVMLLYQGYRNEGGEWRLWLGLPPRAELEQVMAFDTGPGNMVMDALVTALTRGRQTYDRAGRLAASGHVAEKLLAEMLAHPFLRRRPPKTTGREEFGEMFLSRVLASARRLRLRPEDMLATVTAFTAETIADAYRRFVFPKLTAGGGAAPQIILCGGGGQKPDPRGMVAPRAG